MTAPHLEEIHGERLSLRQAAKRYGLEYATVADRWRKGDRGERLVRALDKGNARAPGTNTDLAQMNAERDSKRDLQRKAHAAREARETARRARLLAARAAHAAELARPFISAELLSDEERRRVRQSIVGRQRWWTVDSAYMGTR